MQTTIGDGLTFPTRINTTNIEANYQSTNSRPPLAEAMASPAAKAVRGIIWYLCDNCLSQWWVEFDLRLFTTQKIILRRIWSISANKIRSYESICKQSQIKLNWSLWQIIVTLLAHVLSMYFDGKCIWSRLIKTILILAHYFACTLICNPTPDVTKHFIWLLPLLGSWNYGFWLIYCSKITGADSNTMFKNYGC